MSIMTIKKAKRANKKVKEQNRNKVFEQFVRNYK